MRSVFNKIKQGLSKSRENVSSKFEIIFSSRKGLSEDILEEMEEALITADIGVDTTMMLIDSLREKYQKEKDVSFDEVMATLREAVADDIRPVLQRKSMHNGTIPYVILVIGVNGTGKTTTIGKLAHYYKQQGKRVMLAAGDTFRAAAVEQLEVWQKRIDVEIIKNVEGADSAAVAFDATQSALAKKVDVLIVDTAGRIHTNVNLMQELGKIERVIKKVIPEAPHKTYLVIDANMGQAAISQAQKFTEAVTVHGLILSKLDGTAKGGAAIPIIKSLNIPIDFVGIGEQKDDLEPFNIEEYTSALFSH